VNRLPQTSQTCNFCPEWIRVWAFKWVSNKNLLPHMSHTCIFCPVCDKACIFRLLRSVNLLPHISHTCGLLPICLVICSFSFALRVKLLPHMLHGNEIRIAVSVGSSTTEMQSWERFLQSCESCALHPFVPLLCCADILVFFIWEDNLHEKKIASSKTYYRHFIMHGINLHETMATKDIIQLESNTVT